MPIQFRCVHCRQLLGISNSRAGTQVDCPACGRTLRVPGESGATASAVATSPPRIDAGLLGALSELASLTSSADGVRDANVQTSFSATTSAKTSSVPLPPPVAKKRDSLRIVPLTTAQNKPDENPADLFESPEKVFQQLASLPPVSMDDSPLILTDVEAVDDDEQKPLPAVNKQQIVETHREATPKNARQKNTNALTMPSDLADALAELAGPATSATDANTAIHKNRVSVQQLKVSPPAKPWSLTRILLFTSTLAGAFAAGLFADKLRSGITVETSDLNGVAAKNSEDPEQVVLKQAIPTQPTDSPTIETISGRITYIDNAGAEKPDANALAILLPTANTSSLKLDSAPLRDLQQTPGRLAVESALSVLGASVVRADDDGQFKLPRKLAEPVVLIFVSRHASRPDAETTPAEVSAALSNWLTSPTQLIGRLAAQTQPLSAVAKDTLVPPLKIQFGKTK